MKEDKMRQAIGEINEKLIEEADAEPKRGRSGASPALIVAAAVVSIALIAAFAVPAMIRGGDTPGVAPADESVQSGSEDNTIIIEPSYPTPDLEKLFSDTELIVKGTIIQKIDERHSNPTGEYLNKNGEVISFGVISQYSMLVTDSFYGDVAPGTTIVIDVFLPTGISADQADKYQIINNGAIAEFTDGEEVLLFLGEDKYDVPASDELSYGIFQGEWGVFREQSDGKYRSPVYEIDEDIINDYLCKKGDNYGGE